MDYQPSQLDLYTPVGLTVTVAGASPDVTQLCPASAVFGSSASCEWVVAGTPGPTTGTVGGSYDLCCPKGVTSYYSPARLLASAGYAGPGSSQ